VEKDRIPLNHLGLWRGRHRDRETKPVAGELPKLRKLFFEGDLAEAGQQTMRLLSGQHRGLDSYQPFGELVLEFPEHRNYTHYRRELDMASGVVRISYQVRGVQFTRDRKSTRLNSSHQIISYAVFC